MKHRLVLVLAVAAATVGFVPGSAHAGVTGALCGVVTRETPAGMQSGYLFGGPLSGWGTLECSVQASPLYAAPDLASASTSGGSNLTPSPTPVTFGFTSGYLYLCSTWIGSSGTLHLGDDGLWYADPTTTSCPAAALDPTLCRTIAFVFDGTLLDTVTVEPDGDIYVDGDLAYDCAAASGPVTGSSVIVGLSRTPYKVHVG